VEARDGEGGSSSGGGGGGTAEKVFVGGVSWQATEADLSHFFAQYGTVVDAKIIRDSLTRKSKGCAAFPCTSPHTRASSSPPITHPSLPPPAIPSSPALPRAPSQVRLRHLHRRGHGDGGQGGGLRRAHGPQGDAPSLPRAGR
jgi:hypothetical protein